LRKGQQDQSRQTKINHLEKIQRALGARETQTVIHFLFREHQPQPTTNNQPPTTMSFTSTTTATTSTITSSSGSILKRRVSIDKDGNIVRHLNFQTAAAVVHAATKWRRMAAQSEFDSVATPNQADKHCKCKCKGKRCAFSEDSDLICITETFFFAAALLLSLAFILTAFPEIFADDVPRLDAAPFKFTNAARSAMVLVHPFLPSSMQSFVSCLDSHHPHISMQLQWCVNSTI